MANIVVHISFRPIYDLCKRANNILGSSIFMRWWEHEMGQEVERHIDDYIYIENIWLGAVP